MTDIVSISRKHSLIILGITAVIFSRLLFFFFHDPEGPNLLIVIVVATMVYLVSLTMYVLSSFTDNFKRFWLAIFIQLMLVIGLYFLGLMF